MLLIVLYVAHALSFILRMEHGTVVEPLANFCAGQEEPYLL